jgi:hypothetical protein
MEPRLCPNGHGSQLRRGSRRTEKSLIFFVAFVLLVTFVRTLLKKRRFAIVSPRSHKGHQEHKGHKRLTPTFALT